MVQTYDLARKRSARSRSVAGAVQRAALPGRVKVIVGGAPVSGAWAREISADANGYDAATAVERVRALVAAEA
jgi:methanogenic corrinoid protein MtbC1